MEKQNSHKVCSPRPNEPATLQFQNVTKPQPKCPSLSNPPNNSMPLQQRMQLSCNFCKKVGHQESQCYRKIKNLQRVNHSYRPPNTVNQLQVDTLNSEQQEESLEALEIADTEYPLFPDDSIQLEDS